MGQSYPLTEGDPRRTLRDVIGCIGLLACEGIGMEDIVRRLGAVELAVSEIKAQVASIAAVIPHLATKFFR